jgi:predicted nucleotidyltransferase
MFRIRIMRLDPEQISAIKTAIADILGKAAEVYLFGSRTDTSRRGGDIDLLIVLPHTLGADQRLDVRLKILAELHRRLGERKVDLILREPGRAETAFQQLAREQGIRL